MPRKNVLLPTRMDLDPRELYRSEKEKYSTSDVAAVAVPVEQSQLGDTCAGRHKDVLLRATTALDGLRGLQQDLQRTLARTQAVLAARRGAAQPA